MLLRSAVHVEVDGSFRMNAPIPDTDAVHLLVANMDSCLEAAHAAAQSALDNLHGAKPLMGVMLVDIAWQYLFESRSIQFIEAVQHVLLGIPLIGAYTIGQAVSQGLDTVPVLQNQQLEIVLLGEMEAQ